MSPPPHNSHRGEPVGLALAGPGAVWRGTRNDLLIATAERNVAKATVIGLVSTVMLAAILVHAGYPSWRVLSLALMFTIMVTAQFATIRMVRRHPVCLERAVVCLHGLAQVYMVSVAVVTGGLHSPLVASIGTATALPILFFGTHVLSRRLTVSLVLLFAAMAVLPTSWLGDPLPTGHYVLAAIVSFVWTVLVVTNFLTRLHDATLQASCAVDRLNEEQLAANTERLQRLQAVGAKVAHELKNPLASIKGLVQLVARSTDSVKNQERLEVVRGEIARMEAILAEYLSFSRPLEELRPQTIDVAELVTDVVEIVAGRAEQAKLAMSVEARPTKIAADPRRLKEALLNIVANAIEATPPGGRITFVVRPDGGGAALDVIDTGRGIKPEDLERLGTSFFTTREGGTGLGVVLAHSAVAQHGGTLRYTSAVGRGTQVSLRLPSAPAPSSTGAPIIAVDAKVSSAA